MTAPYISFLRGWGGGQMCTEKETETLLQKEEPDLKTAHLDDKATVQD